MHLDYEFVAKIGAADADAFDEFEAADADEFVAKIGAVDADIFNEFRTQISVDADARDESVGGSILSSSVASFTMTISKS